MRLKRLTARTGAASLIAGMLALLLGAQPAQARQPVSQCTLPGQMLSSQASMAGLALNQSSEEGFPDGTIKPVEPNLGAFKPRISSEANVGRVNPKTGAFSYSSEDISVGQGEFPARLHITRTYSSDRDSSAYDGIFPLFGPGAPDIRNFGRGSTHNLDIRFRTGKQVFGESTSGPAYDMVYVSFGFSTLSFQKCANGEYVSSNRDGARLFEDSSYGSGGYRVELRDGTRIFLSHSGLQFCTPLFAWSDVGCGRIRRWEAPNGDWAEFDYQSYYDKPDSAINQHLNTDHRIDSYENTKPLCIDTPTMQNDCREVDATYYFYHDSLSYWENRTNNPMFDLRIVSIRSSRGYRLDFTYVDSSTNIGTVCQTQGTSGGPGVNCLPPANELQQRGLIQSIKAYSGSTLLKQISYQYAGHYLTSYQAPDGAVTKYAFSNALPNPPTYKIFQANDHNAPITTVTFAMAKADLFQHLPIDIFQSGFTEHAYREYPRVVSQSFADGRVVQYNPTFSAKWVTDTSTVPGYPRTNWRPVHYISQMQVVEPGNRITVHLFGDEDAPVQTTDALSNITVNTYDDVGKLLSTTSPEGDKIVYTYDVRGNVIQSVRHPKPQGGPAVTETATYVGGATVPANSCANQKTCNRPSTSTDGRGFTTDYSWDAASGMMASITGPADPNGVRPQTSYGYTNYPGPVSGTLRLLTSKTEKIDGSQSVVTNYGYDPAKYFPKEIVEDPGGLDLRTCMKFDQAGVPVSETAPKANLASCP